MIIKDATQLQEADRIKSSRERQTQSENAKTSPNARVLTKKQHSQRIPVANETLAKLAAIQAAAPLIILITTRFAKT
jgi:hypothetical protein